VSAFSVARLVTGAIVATMVTAAIGTASVAAFRRRPTLGLVAGVVAVAVGALWCGLLAVVGSGFPSDSAFRALRVSLLSSRGLLVSFALPVAHTPGMVLLGVLAGGLIAVVGRAVGTWRPTVSLVPAVATVAWSAISLPATGAAAAGLVLAGCGFVLMAGGWSVARRTVAVIIGVSLAAAALAVGWSAAAGSDVASPGGPQVPAVAPSALSLATDLTGLERRDADVVLFRATSPVSTYWQVATLSTYAGYQWIPDPETRALMDGTSPSPTSAPAGDAHVFGSTVTLSAYSGRLLPAPPETVRASGEVSPVVTPSGVVATGPVRAGSSYTATAVVPPVVSRTPAGVSPPGADTALGPIPGSVRALALTITGGQAAPLDKAEALTGYFRSGAFHYSINAAQPAGVDPLVAFLTRTRTGSCQQFAGAFAVLARASGLATRVAVGFTPGRTVNGVAVIRGGDAHAWPQVLIGASWVSFEPTPQLPSGELSPPGVLGPAGLGQANPTGHAAQPPVSIPVVSIPAPTIPPAAAPAPPGGHPVTVTVVSALALAVLAVLAVLAAVVLARRRRRRHTSTHADRLMATWNSLDRALVRRGMGRPLWRTPMAHIRVLSSRQAGEQARATIEDMTVVGSALEGSTYGSVHVTAQDAQLAVLAGGRARRAILGGALSPDEPGDPASDERGAPSGVFADS